MSQFYSGWKGHKWAQPKVSHLQQLMRDVYINRSDLKVKGALARTSMIERFSLEIMGLKLVREFSRVLRKIDTKLSEVQVDSVSSNDGEVIVVQDS